MGTTTSRVGLYKPLSDGSELVNVSQDLNGNSDALDLAVGFQACTSSTRPATPYSGKPIFETNTSYRTFFSNGTLPASGSWVEIPNSSGTYGGNLTLGGTLAVSGTVNLTGALSLTGVSALVERALTTENAYRARIVGDANSRLLINADGKIIIGDGVSVGDVNLYRSAANILATDDDFAIVTAGKGLRVKEGSNAKMGTATLNGTTGVVVSTTAVTATSRIILTTQASSATYGAPVVVSRVAATSFTIKSTTASDTSSVAWMLVEPA